jgi:hypothetical protein
MEVTFPMKSVNKTGIRLLMLLVVGTLVVGCGPRATPAPTVDTNAIFTAAAVTIQAQLTETANAMPQPTNPPPSTETLVPLPTLPPLPGQDTVVPGQTAVATAFVLPTLSLPTASRIPAADKAQWIGNSPADGTTMSPGVKFDIIWTIKNVGTTTWSKQYTYRYYSGAKLNENKNSYFLRSEILPGQQGDMIVDGLSPATPGEYYTLWVITNADGTNFGQFDITIKVVANTKTPTP